MATEQMSLDQIEILANEALLGAGTLPESAKSVSKACLLYTSPSPRDVEESRMPSSA